jgi:hypothetical protein
LPRQGLGSDQREVVGADAEIDRRGAQRLSRLQRAAVAQQPLHHLAIGIAQEDVAAPVAVRVAGALDVKLDPGRANRLDRLDLRRMIEQPFRQRSVVVAEKEVGGAAVPISPMSSEPGQPTA